MVQQLKWIESPDPRVNEQRGVTLAQLRANPGRWAEVGRYISRSSANATAQRLQNASRNEEGVRQVRAVVRKSGLQPRPFVVQAAWLGGEQWS